MSKFTHALVFLAVATLTIGFSLYRTHASVPQVKITPVVTAAPVIAVDQQVIYRPSSNPTEVATLIQTESVVIEEEIEEAAVEEVEIEEAEPPVLPPTETITKTLKPETTPVIVKEEVLPRSEIKPEQPPTIIAETIMTLTNETRHKYDFDEVTYDARLSVLAQERSDDMIDQNYLSHTSPSGCDITCQFEKVDYDSLVWGENIAEFKSNTQKDSYTVATMVMDDWLHSATHRDNILSLNYTRQGIGVATKKGRTVVTVLFANPQ